MSASIRCPHCRHPFPFAEEERGQAVYCPSCGKACLVPPAAPVAAAAGAPARAAGPPAAPPPPARPGVFRRSFATSKVAEVHCLACGHTVPVTVAVLGGKVPCPRCGAPTPTAGAVAAPQPAADAPPLRPQPEPLPWWRPRSAWAVFALAVLGGLLVVGVVVVWQRPLVLTELARLVSPTPVRPWEPGDGTGPEVKDKKGAEKEITLEDIEALLRRPDAAEALVEAQAWQIQLTDRGVPRTDRRQVRLAEVIKELAARLVPPKGPPPAYVDEFRGLVRQLREALTAGDLVAGRRAVDRADALLTAHPRELAPYSQAFVELKKKLEKLEREVKGVQEIRDGFTRARELARKFAGPGQPPRWDVTRALEDEARAKFIALRTPLEPAEEDELDRLARELAPDLLFARGKRAAEEAAACERDGDSRTRDLLVDEAEAVLPGLRHEGVEEALATARAARSKPVPGGDSSELGREVAFRRAYEAALVPFAAGELGETSAATVERALKPCCEAHTALAAIPPLKPEWGARLAAVALDLVERAVEERVALHNDTPELRQKLLEARVMLDQAAPWKDDPRWRKLDAIVRNRGEEAGSRALAHASELAKKDDWEGALRATEAAEALGKPEVADQARDLTRKWKAELKLRTERAAADEHWKRLGQLEGAEKLLERWRELQLFLGRYPAAPQRKDARALADELLPRVRARADELLVRLEGHARDKDWAAFRRLSEVLLAAPLSPAQAERVNQQNETVAEEVRGEAKTKFNALKAKYEFMIGPEEIVALLEGLPKVLELDPAHAAAKALLEKALARGKGLATHLYKNVDEVRPQGEKAYRERLELIGRLDPDGLAGETARGLVEQMKKP